MSIGAIISSSISFAILLPMLGSALTINYDSLADQREEVLKVLKKDGYISLRGVPGYTDAYSAFMVELARFSALPEEEQRKCTPAEGSNNLGWDRGIEKFEGIPDLYKGSFYAHLPNSPSNLWPDDQYKEAYLRLAEVIRDAGHALAKAINIPIPEFNYVARGLDYAPIPEPPSTPEGSIPPPPPPNWCGPHNDHSALTGICAPTCYDLEGREMPEPATAGLYIDGLGKADIPPDCLGFQIGEVSQIVTEGKENEVRATRHLVRGMYGARRRTFALFFAPKPDYRMWSSTKSFPGRFRNGMIYKEWHEESLSRYKV